MQTLLVGWNPLLFLDGHFQVGHRASPCNLHFDLLWIECAHRDAQHIAATVALGYQNIELCVAEKRRLLLSGGRTTVLTNDWNRIQDE